MLIGLSIRDIVLIDRLDIEFSEGLCVLTGETGAGKSIILDSLGLATGARADRSFVRQGQDKGSVVAEFEAPNGVPLGEEFEDLELDAGENIILKRVVTKDGRTRAYVNDQPVAVSTLSKIGEALLEIHGQHGDRHLMDTAAHRSLLDSFGGLHKEVASVNAAYDSWNAAQRALRDHEKQVEELEKERDYLLHARDELEALDPQPDEEPDLAERRSFMMQAESVHDEVTEVQNKLVSENGIERELYRVLRQLAGIQIQGTDRLEEAIKKLETASTDIADATQIIDGLVRDLEFNPMDLEATEERLFALRAASRKHNVTVDALPKLLQDMTEKIDTLNSDEAKLGDLKVQVAECEKSYREVCSKLTKKRTTAAKKLDREIKKELPPLKLEKALFETKFMPLAHDGPSRFGAEAIEFHAATNPNTPMGAIGKVASGGELARFALALKVVLQKANDQKTLIFDEVDQGIGGAVADAVGERLQSLSDNGQVLVITHSPQVAARANHHWRIRKAGSSKKVDQVLTRIEGLDDKERREEIARMLAGAKVTDEARAAADQLLRQR